MAPNEAQRDLWNAEEQTTTWPRRERITNSVTRPLIELLALQPGERVLDVGCGGGLAALAAATAVTPSGAVTGFDISAPLVRLSTQRAADAEVKHARFVAGDAQVDAPPGAPFDAAMSQFGVMFFADPIAAFTNIRRQLRPGGRMAFACWQSPAKNTWFPGPLFAAHTSPPRPSESGAPPPGPFAFADAAYVKGILEQAGFADIAHQELAQEVDVPENSVYDRQTVLDLRIDPEKREQLWNDLQKLAATLRGPDGLLHLHLGPQLFHARNPA